MSDYKVRWSDYKLGKVNSEVWAQSVSRMIEAAGASKNPLSDMIEYKTRVAKGIFSSMIPTGVAFSDAMMVKTHQTIMTKLPIWQRELLFEFLFGEQKKRETSDIKAIYKAIGREIRG